MKILVQNLQKKPSLATTLAGEHDPHVMLVQEINLHSETFPFQATYVSSMGYGTAISSKGGLRNIRLVESPHAEFGGFIRKKTTVCTVDTSTTSLQFVSFHGYNGQPFKSIEKLVAHVKAVIAVLSPGPAIFAGDFNSWSKGHLTAVNIVLEKAGFHLAYSWPYPGRDFSLDHAFLRGVRLKTSSHFESGSDHLGAILEVDFVDEEGRIAEGGGRIAEGGGNSGTASIDNYSLCLILFIFLLLFKKG